MASEDHRSRRIVLSNRPADHEVQRFADELGWPRLGEEHNEIAGETSREIAWGAGPALTLHYIEDPLSDNSYVMAWGTDEKAVDALIELAAANLSVWGLDEMLQAVDNADDPLEKARAVIRVGLGAPDKFDERFFDCVLDAISSSNTTVREAGIYATSYSSYPQYRSVLKRVAETDPDSDRQEDARNLLESFDIEGVAQE